MKKIKLILSLLMVLFISVGNVWATDFTLSSAAEVTNDGITVTFAKGEGSTAPAWYDNGLRLYVKNTVTITSTANITEISFNWEKQGSKTFNSSCTASVGSYTHPSSAGVGTWTGSATSITFTLGDISSAQLQLNTFSVTTEGGGTKTLSSVAVSGAPTKTSYYAGQNFDPAGLTVTGTYSDASTAPITSGITWSYDPSQELALNQTSIGVIATVSEIASPKVDVSITVTEAPAAVNYEKVTAAPEDWSGEYLLVYEDGTDAYVYTGVDAASNYVSATIESNQIALPENAATLTIAAMEGGYSIMVNGGTNDGKYLSGTSGSNATNFNADAVANTLGYSSDHATITSNTSNLTFNSASNNLRFRYFKATSTMAAVQLYKKVEGAVLPSAELAFADANHLVKVGASFTAPTLTNPHSVAVTYASSDADVVAVSEDGATVTIKAAGKAVITASFAGDTEYRDGSASYTIYVAAQAGTAEEPLTEASAKALIDLGCGMDVYMVGTVATKNYYTTSKTYTVDLAGGMQYYYFYEAAGETVFETDYLKVGDIITAYGTLKKVSDKYRLNPSYMVNRVEYTEPLNDISNTKETAYSVATALTKATDPTSDLDNSHVFISGVVYSVKNFDSENGTLDIYIKDAGVDNKFEFFKCKGINDGSATIPFASADDVQVGNVVIGYGMLKYYSGGSIWEFDNTKDGDYLVELQAPVTGVELNATSEVEEGQNINLTATILPSNATGTIVWTVESGDAYASVDGGVVTGIAEGEAVIRATVQGTEIYAECTVTVTAAAPALTDYYEKVTSGTIGEGTYLIVYEDGNVAFDGGLNDSDNDHKLDKVGNTIDITIVDGNKIAVTQETAAATFYIDPAAGTIQAASGRYIGVTSYTNGLASGETGYAHSSMSIDGEGDAVLYFQKEEWNNNQNGKMQLCYNSDSNQKRFRYYKEGSQKAIQLYKLANEVIKPAAGLAWNPADDIELIVGGAFTAPTLYNPNNIDAAEITIESSNTDLATIENGVVSLVADATGTATITATFDGNASYKPATVSYKIKVNPAQSIFVNKLSVNFGSVNVGDAVPADEKVTVTLTNVASVTATLGGDNADAFSISPASLTESGDITISVLANTDAEASYSATITISDGAEGAEDKTVNLSFAVTAPEVPETAVSTSSKWVAATDADLVDGAVVLITGVKEVENVPVTYAMGSDRGNNRNAVAGTLDEGVFTPGEGTMAFTLVDQGDGTFALKASNDKYLYAASSSSNNLKTRAAIENGDAKWTLTATSAVANGESTNETLRFNKGNNPEIFSCYADDTKQTAIAFYVPKPVTPTTYDVTYVSAHGAVPDAENAASVVLGELTEDGWTHNGWIANANVTVDDAEVTAGTLIANGKTAVLSAAVQFTAQWTEVTPPTPDYGSYQRDVTCGNYGTICLPKAGTISGAKLYELADYEGGMIYVDEITDGAMVAGRPYLFFATSAQLNVAYTSDQEEATAGNYNGLYGFYNLNDPEATLTLVDDATLGNYILYQNQYWLVSGRAASIANYRAYIKVDMINYVAPAPGRQRVAMVVNGNQVATGIENAEANEVPTKMLINGQLFIIRGEKMYNVNGQVVK